ncbi:hypothetical protein KEJ39_09230 [Candidatus Bathyarchaeota archaeon]|nr:hypothetical protein [Candidatus Bathyarchaeota archaeon]
MLPRCESVIEDYRGQDFPDATVSDTVKYVCAMLAAKIIQYIIMNATAPIVKIGDHHVEVQDSSPSPWISRIFIAVI